MVNVRRRQRPARTSAASVRSPVPAPHATAPAPRQGGLATVVTRASATVAPTRWRRSTGSSAKRIIVERMASVIVEQMASVPDFDNVLVGRSIPPFPSLKSRHLWWTTTTRANWGASKTTTPPDTHNCPSTIRSMTALRGRCCCLLSNLTRTTTTMTHHPHGVNHCL